MEDKVKIRTNFIGSIFILLSILTLLGGLYTIGFWLLLLCWGAYCIANKKREFVGLIHVNIYRGIYLSLCVVSVIIWFNFGAIYGLSWCIASFAFSITDPYLRVVYSLGGLFGAFS